MAKVHPDRRAFSRAIRKHINQLIARGITRNELQVALGVTKQAISSYVTGRTTPKPYIIRRLLNKWPSETLSYRDRPVSAEDFDVPMPAIKAVPSQGELFAILRSIKPQDLNIDVDRTGASHVELKVLIRIAG